MILFLFKKLILCLLFTTYVNSWEGYHTELDDELPAISWKECGISVRNCDPKTTFKDPFVSSRVWGGEYANTGEYPWYVSLYVGDGNYHCGGAIINEWWILTAGHCFLEALNEKSPVFVRMGALNTFEGQPIIAERVVIHRIYMEKSDRSNELYSQMEVLENKISINQIKDGNKTLLKQLIQQYLIARNVFDTDWGNVSDLQWDIALLKSKNRIVPLFNETHYKINSICLPKSGITNTKNESAVIIGMGTTDPNKYPSYGRKLKKGITKILDTNTCTHYLEHIQYKYNVKDNICFKRLNTQTNSLLNSSLCSGDSGSPLHQYYKCKAVQMGVHSRKEDLLGPYCGRYLLLVRVSIFMPWIRSVILPNDIIVIISETNILLIVSVITISIIALIFCFTLLWITILALKRRQHF